MNRPAAYLWRTRTGNRWLAGGFLAVVLGAFGVAAGRGWSLTGRLPSCAFQRFTGWRCPGCGGTRMAAALLRGDVAQAWYYHPLLLIALAGAVGLAVWLFSRSFCRRWTPPALSIRSRWWLALPAVVVIFLVLRNTPWYQLYFY